MLRNAQGHWDEEAMRYTLDWEDEEGNLRSLEINEDNESPPQVLFVNLVQVIDEETLEAHGQVLRYRYADRACQPSAEETSDVTGDSTAAEGNWFKVFGNPEELLAFKEALDPGERVCLQIQATPYLAVLSNYDLSDSEFAAILAEEPEWEQVSKVVHVPEDAVGVELSLPIKKPEPKPDDNASLMHDDPGDHGQGGLIAEPLPELEPEPELEEPEEEPDFVPGETAPVDMDGVKFPKGGGS